MHASLVHIGCNMVFLWVFGQGLEANYLGSTRFAVFYFLCGFAASSLQIAVDPTSTIPNVGASGAIAGVMGGYMVVFPSDQIQTLVVGILGIYRTRITSAVFIGIWFLIQLASGFGSLASVNEGGVAYFAHIGGFIGGVLLIRLFGIGVSRPYQARGLRFQ
jgi:membrane associated rhomboid family serine protease